ncbi:hypothetical protein BS78_01G214300 [Paspalum vaginatum]|nr:hypothetical protein BS78_01G214300 [Paspalum vaginatum]
MASSLQGQNTGGSSSGRSAAAVKQLLSRLRCTWRRRATRLRRPAAVSFGYDLHSYSQNFDDGHCRRPLPLVVVGIYDQ